MDCCSSIHIFLEFKPGLYFQFFPKSLKSCVAEFILLYKNWFIHYGCSLRMLHSNTWRKIALSFVLNVSPKTFKRYVDDKHVRFENKQESLQFLVILNKSQPFIRYNTEFENDQKQLNLLDITITNSGTNPYDFKIFRKPAVTNVQIKSNSNMAANISVSVFERFLSRAYKIYSKCYIDKEIQLLIDVFTGDGWEI